MDSEGGLDELLEDEASASNDKRVTFSPLILVLNRDQQETNIEETENSSAESPDPSDTLSSSSSNSSLDDFIPINSEILLKYKGESSTLQPNGGTKSPCVKQKFNVPREGFYRLEESIDECLGSTSQSSDATRESVREHILPTLSPSIQVMEWPKCFNSSGICAPHSRTPSKLKEDNSASDDSLLIKPDDEAKLNISKAIGEDVKPGERGMIVEPINDVSKAPSTGDSMDYSTAKFQSDKRVTNNLPIALPIKKKSSSPLCRWPECCSTFRCCKCPIHCCKCPIRCCKWPSCSFKWFIMPSCSRHCFSWLACCSKCSIRCSKWPGCSRNCLNWLGCCFKSPNCHYNCPIWSCCCVKRKS